MQSKVQADAGERPFAAMLDAVPLSKLGRAILLLSALALIYFCITPSSIMGLLSPKADGIPATSFYWPNWLQFARSMLLVGAFSFVIGVIANVASPYLKPFIGAILIAIVTAVKALILLSISPQTVTAIDGSYLVHYKLGIDLFSLLPTVIAFFCAALGGVFSPRLFQHMKVSVAAWVIWAWIIVYFMGHLQGSIIYYAFPRGFSYSDWSITWVLFSLLGVLPYFLGGFWLGFAFRGRRLRFGLRAIVALIVLQLLGGGFPISHSTLEVFWITAFNYISPLLTSIISASVGLWLGALLVGKRPRRELLRPAFGILVLGWCLLFSVP